MAIEYKIGDCLELMKELPDNSIDSIVTDPPYGISFMGKKWDYDVPKVEVWKECLRVLKPGGHILVACGTRTQHRMAVNIEDAGFELRDLIAWIYGSGFPKSLNIGKAVDKKLGNERESIGTIKGMGKQNPEWNGTAQGRKENSFKPEYESSKGTSPYEGWGTALKPAMELWTLARKPLSEKTVAENVLKWGTGGINIDDCRVPLGDEKQPTGSAKRVFANNQFTEDKNYGDNKQTPEQGRFPANLIHDGHQTVLDLFPKTGKSSGGRIGNKGSNLNMMGNNFEKGDPGFGDSGSAARFFYCAKASKSERNKGLEGLEEKNKKTLNEYKSPSEGRTANKSGSPMSNFHPTVKPVKLMRYLVRLITPKDGLVLDPYLGSGTTGIACQEEGFNFLGFEMSEEYEPIIRGRLGLDKKEVF